MNGIERFRPRQAGRELQPEKISAASGMGSGAALWGLVSAVVLMSSCSLKPFEGWLLSRAFVGNAPDPQTLVPHTACGFNAAENPEVASLPVSWSLGQKVRLAGYGVFPFWRLAPWSFSNAFEDDPATDRITGHLLLVRGQTLARGHAHQGGMVHSWWVLLTLDTLGIATPIADRLRSESARVVGESLQDTETVPPCVVTSVVASHSHSGPDLTGLWGASARSWKSLRNQDAWREVTESALVGSFARDLARAAAELRPRSLRIAQAHVPTSADRQEAARALRPNMSLLRFSRRHAVSADSGPAASATAALQVADPALLIWNGHATTDPSDRRNASGDYPAALARAVGAELNLSFLPGAVAGQYPLVAENWLEKLTDEVLALAQGQAVPFDLGVSEINLCVPFEARHAELFAAWAAWWGVPAIVPCSLRFGNAKGFRVTLQRVTFNQRHQAENKTSRSAFSLYLTPFEMFAEVESFLSPAQTGQLSASRDLLGARFVSFANGFSGHALTSQAAGDLMSATPASRSRAKPYHLWMSLVRSVDAVVQRWQQVTEETE